MEQNFGIKIEKPSSVEESPKGMSLLLIGAIVCIVLVLVVLAAEMCNIALPL